MSTRTVFGTGFMLAMLLATFASFAQEAEDIGPAVEVSPRGDTSAIEPDELQPAVEVSPQGDTSAADEEPEPAVETSPDITRTTTNGGVMDQMTLGRTEVTGNQELPKVLYIVPWQKSDPGDLMGKPVNTLLDEVLAPIDREEFIRQVDYHDDLYGESE